MATENAGAKALIENVRLAQEAMAKAPWAKTVPDAAKVNPRIKTKQFAMTSASPLTESLQASVSAINEFIDGLR